jgi:hypothetical protein
MARVIPNQRVLIGYLDTLSSIAAWPVPTKAELISAVNWTCNTASLTANATGNTVPIPSLCSLFESSLPGTSTATFTADFYFDDEDNSVWETMVRGSQGYFVINRMLPAEPPRWSSLAPPMNTMIITGDLVEVWPIYVTSRMGGPLTSNTPETMTINCAVPFPPLEDYVVPAT